MNKINTVFIKPAADVFYGSIQVTYKKLRFFNGLRGSWGNYMYNNVDSNFGTDINVLLRQTDLSNGVANLLETRFAKSNDLQLHSDYYVQDASFIKLNNECWLYFQSKPESSSLVKLTLSAQNVLTITKYDGLDPEIWWY
jgi:iron complex outermembrane receptor protein